MTEPGRHPFQLSHDEMEAIGQRALDFVIRHFETNRDSPVAKQITRAEAERLLRTDLPEQGTPVGELFDVLARDVFPNGFRTSLPGTGWRHRAQRRSR